MKFWLGCLIEYSLFFFIEFFRKVLVLEYCQYISKSKSIEVLVNQYIFLDVLNIGTDYFKKVLVHTLFVVRTNVCGSLYWSKHIVHFATWPIWLDNVNCLKSEPSKCLFRKLLNVNFFLFFGEQRNNFSYTFFNFTPFIMCSLQ